MSKAIGLTGKSLVVVFRVLLAAETRLMSETERLFNTSTRPQPSCPMTKDVDVCYAFNVRVNLSTLNVPSRFILERCLLPKLLLFVNPVSPV